MRRHAIRMLFIALAMVSGACAGRQIRTRTMPVPSKASSVAPAAVSIPAAELVAVAPLTPVIEPILVQETDAAISKTSIVPSEDDPRIARMVPTVAHHARSKSRVASAIKVMNGAAVGRLVVAPRTIAPAITRVITTSPPPSILPSPPMAQTDTNAGLVTGRAFSPEPESLALFIPDRSAVEKIHAYWSTYLLGALLAAGLSIISGLVIARCRTRRIETLLSERYDKLPDGAMLLHESVGGVTVSTQVILPNLLQPRSESEASMDDFERKWNAEGDAMRQNDESAIEPLPHDLFDLSDAFDSTEPPLSSKQLLPLAPLASGSGSISSSEAVLTASGMTEAHDPSLEPTPQIETYPSVIYDSASATASN